MTLHLGLKIGFTGLIALSFTLNAQASGSGSGYSSLNVPSAPASQGLADLDNGQLQAGAAGAYLPLPPATIPSGGTDPTVPRVAGAPPPALGDCPPGLAIQPNATTSGAEYPIYPWFTRNAVPFNPSGAA